MSHKSHLLRPLSFLYIIVGVISATVGLLFLLMVALVRPIDQSYDIRQQAQVLQSCSNILDIPIYECEALAKFYEQTSGGGWRLNTGEIGWFTTQRACEWVGISCDGNSNLDYLQPIERQITGITLPSRRLFGQLPPIWSSLSELAYVDLSSNSLSGSLTNSQLLTQSSLITVALNNNQLTGSIPEVFSGEHVLVSLNLSSNQLSGPLPVSLGKAVSLRQLQVNSNSLSGPLPDSLRLLPLTVFFTRQTELCLPSAMQTWHQGIAQTDPLSVCGAQPTSPPTCNSICRDNNECPNTLICHFDASRTGNCRLASNPSNTQCQPVPPTATPTPTGIPGSGGTTLSSCNQTCDTNANCINNLRCFDVGGAKRCRLATNPSSESCQGVPDQGLAFACNEYCSNTGECADSLVCWYNRCRQPLNVTSTSCQQPDAQLQQQMQSSCNQSCQSNRDCPVNMRCFNSQCRLAINPSSQICSPIQVVQQAIAPTSPPKGATLPTLPPDLTPSVSPSETESPDFTVSPTSAPTPFEEETEFLSEPPIVEPPIVPPQPQISIIDRITDFFGNLTSTFDSSELFALVQSKLLTIGLVLGGIIFLILGFITGKKKKQQPNRFSAPTPVQTNPDNSRTMIERVKEKGIA